MGFKLFGVKFKVESYFVSELIMSLAFSFSMYIYCLQICFKHSSLILSSINRGAWINNNIVRLTVFLVVFALI